MLEKIAGKREVVILKGRECRQLILFIATINYNKKANKVKKFQLKKKIFDN